MANDMGISRRNALAGLAGSAALLAGEKTAVAAASNGTEPIVPAAANVCRMTPEAVEGPFYFDPDLDRADITEGRLGIPLTLVLQVIEGATCVPIEGARVDVWHCDAIGHYSGYDRQGDDGAISTKGEKFLRGSQVTGRTGETVFKTIYPGWYRGRTAHIHVKVLLGDATMLTGQMYFPDALSEYIFTSIPPYNERKAKRDTVNSTDFIALGDKDHASFVSIKEEADAYVATLVIGVDRAASPARPGPGRPPGPPPGAGGPPPGGPPPGMEGGPSRSRGTSSLVPGGKKSD